MDFIQYWSAWLLFSQGANPYDANAMLLLQQGITPLAHGPTMMWVPPLVFPLLGGLILPDFHHALWCWHAQGLLTVAFACFLFCMPSPALRLPIRLLCASTFFALPMLLHFGQISHFLLLGTVLLFRGIVFDRPRSTAISAILIALKPHVFFLLLAALGLNALRNPRLRVHVLYAATSILIISAIAELLHPGIHQLWWAAAVSNNPDAVRPAQWLVATVPGYLRSILSDANGMGSIWPSVLIPLLALTVLVGVGIFGQPVIVDRNTYFPLLAVSFLSSPYGWGFDMIILLPLYLMTIGICIEGWRHLRMAAALIFVSCFAVQIVTTVLIWKVLHYQHQIWWMPAVLLVQYFAARRVGLVERPTITG